MKFKYLIASAALVIGVAAYTLTLSFTETDLMSQLEALANGEDGESGGGESGGENPESGGGQLSNAKEEPQQKLCSIYAVTRTWTTAPDGTQGWSYNYKFQGTDWFPMIACTTGSSTCIPADPCPNGNYLISSFPLN